MIRFSVIIPSHNPDRAQMRFCLRSVTQQLDTQAHQMLVLDDQSTTPLDGLVREFPGVRYHRTDSELYGLKTTNLGFSMTDGDLVQVLHPDDFVLAGYYSAVADAATRFPDRALYATSHLECDEFGRPFAAPSIDWLGGDGKVFRPIHEGNPLAVAACCYSKSFLAEHGGWDERLQHTADWELYLRTTSLGGAVSIGWPLAVYRHSASNHTGRLMRTADNLRDYWLLADVAEAYMPVDRMKLRGYIAMRARMQADLFRSRKDGEAAKANDELAAEMAASQS